MAVDNYGDHIPGTPRTGDLGVFYGTPTTGFTLVINPSAEAWPGVNPTWNGTQWVDPLGGPWNPQPARPQPVDNSGPAAFAQAVVLAFVGASSLAYADAGAGASAAPELAGGGADLAAPVAIDTAPSAVIDAGATAPGGITLGDVAGTARDVGSIIGAARTVITLVNPPKPPIAVRPIAPAPRPPAAGTAPSSPIGAGAPRAPDLGGLLALIGAGAAVVL